MTAGGAIPPIAPTKTHTMFINDSVSFSDDKTDDFEVFTIEAVYPHGVKLHGIDRIIPRHELIIVH